MDHPAYGRGAPAFGAMTWTSAGTGWKDELIRLRLNQSNDDGTVEIELTCHAGDEVILEAELVGSSAAYQGSLGAGNS